MTRRIWTTAAALAALPRWPRVPAALAAYTSAKLTMTTTGGNGRDDQGHAQPRHDDPTARVRSSFPTGTQLTTHPGARDRARPGAGASCRRSTSAARTFRSKAELVVAAARAVSPATQAACPGATTPLASWLMVLRPLGRRCLFRRTSSRRLERRPRSGLRHSPVLPAAT